MGAATCPAGFDPVGQTGQTARVFYWLFMLGCCWREGTRWGPPRLRERSGA
jgi:hypothetical protein